MIAFAIGEAVQCPLNQLCRDRHWAVVPSIDGSFVPSDADAASPIVTSARLSFKPDTKVSVRTQYSGRSARKSAK